MKTTRILPLLLLLPALQAFADTPIQLQHAATPTVLVSISNIAGAVHVTAWDRNQVQVGGTLGYGAKPLAITGSDDHLSIKVEPQGNGSWFDWGNSSRMGSTTLDVHVPRGASLKVDVVSASLSVDGTRGGRLKLDSISGRLRIDAQTPFLDVNSVSGNIAFAGQADAAHLQTVSGDIHASSLGRDANLQTVSGQIQASGGPWQHFKLSTVSGDAGITGSLLAGGGIGIDSMSGDVDLALPANLSATIHASTFSGDLHSDFGKPVSSGYGPGTTLQATVGGGHGSIDVDTFSGDLSLRRQD